MGALDRRILLQLNLWSLGLLFVPALLNAAALSSRVSESKILPSVFARLATNPAVLADAAWFVAACIGVHVALACAWFLVWRPLAARVTEPRRRWGSATLSFVVVLLGVALANAALFPRSAFAADLPPGGAAALAVVAAVIALGAAAAAVVSVARRGRRVATAALVVAAVLVSVVALDGRGAGGRAPRASPDVIVIGIDSLRVDHVDAGLTPSIAAALDGAAVVHDAWTPLGRTFPAWVSILTGRYPSAHGADFNLTRRDAVAADDGLGHDLGALGYERIYAIDETRFSNLDAGYGFDRVVAPAIGAFDFVAGFAGDLPLVNLVQATRAGAALFPYLHMNRGHAVGYRPRTFDAALRRAVAAADPALPLFLVAHFELPHWPYHWAERERDVDALAPALAALTPVSYRHAVVEADRQVGALLDALAAAGRLDDAVLVLLSDHGESFRGSEPRWGARTPAVGHGTDVLSVAQNRVLLAFRGYGPQAARAAAIGAGTASLVDVRPTLHDWLGLARPRASDGISLLSRATDAARVVTVETGFTPAALRAGVTDAFAAAEQGAENYVVGDDGRAALRDDLVERLRASKQRAAVSGRWILAALPPRGGARAELVLADVVAGAVYAPDAAPAAAPVDALLATLCARFGADLGAAGCR